MSFLLYEFSRLNRLRSCRGSAQELYAVALDEVVFGAAHRGRRHLANFVTTYSVMHRLVGPREVTPMLLIT